MSDPGSMAKTVSIRQNLLRNLTLIVLALGLAILAMTFVGSRNAMRRFSQALIDQTPAFFGQRLRLAARKQLMEHRIKTIRHHTHQANQSLDLRPL